MSQRLILALVAGSTASLALTGASLSFAQPAVSPDTITVTGVKLEKKEARKQSYSFVGRTTTTTLSQYGRYGRPICPRVIGVDQRYADIVVTKVQDIARSASIKVAEGDCRPNMFVLFTTDGNALIEILRKAKPVLFSDVAVSERTKLYNNAVPIRWWHRIEIGGSDGNTVARSISPQGFETLESKSSSSSLIDTKLIIDLAGAIVVVDVNKANGYPLESIAAYAAMVSFAQIKPENKHDSLSSVLAMFGPNKSPADAPRDLTRFDYAYVSSLYEIQLNRAGSTQKSQIASRMAAKLSE